MRKIGLCLAAITLAAAVSACGGSTPEAGAPADSSTPEAAAPLATEPPPEAAAPVPPGQGVDAPPAGGYPGEPMTGELSATASGLQSVVLTEGTGAMPTTGEMVSVHYTGYLLDGTQFDSSVGGDPIQFALGTGRVIDGWEEGIALMKAGEKRKFVIPPELGYGATGYPPSIPPNAVLVFDVELVDVGQPAP